MPRRARCVRALGWLTLLLMVWAVRTTVTGTVRRLAPRELGASARSSGQGGPFDQAQGRPWARVGRARGHPHPRGAAADRRDHRPVRSGDLASLAGGRADEIRCRANSHPARRDRLGTGTAVPAPRRPVDALSKRPVHLPRCRAQHDRRSTAPISASRSFRLPPRSRSACSAGRTSPSASRRRSFRSWPSGSPTSLARPSGRVPSACWPRSACRWTSTSFPWPASAGATTPIWRRSRSARI